jgi:hypothetical protein
MPASARVSARAAVVWRRDWTGGRRLRPVGATGIQPPTLSHQKSREQLLHWTRGCVKNTPREGVAAFAGALLRVPGSVILRPKLERARSVASAWDADPPRARSDEWPCRIYAPRAIMSCGRRRRGRSRARGTRVHSLAPARSQPRIQRGSGVPPRLGLLPHSARTMTLRRRTPPSEGLLCAVGGDRRTRWTDALTLLGKVNA